MLAWFEPWKSDHFVNGTITIPHKPVADDIFRQLYPFRVLGMDLIKEFKFPLWNPYNGLGMPLLATLNTGILDPFNILFLLFPSHMAWSIYIVVQPFLIFLGMYLYTHALGLRTEASLFASVTFLFSGTVITRIVYGSFGLAIACLSLLFYLVEEIIKNQKKGKVLLIPILVACIIFSTPPQISLYIVGFFLLYSVIRIFSLHNRQHIFLKILSMIILGFGISAVQLIPTFELFQHSNISTESSQFIFEKFLLPLAHLITIFIPNYFGNIGTYNFWGHTDYIETALYMGLIPLLFACVAIVQKREKPLRNIIYFFITTTIITILTTLQTPINSFLYSLPIPILSTGIPSRIFVLTSFSLSILAGIGFNNFLNVKKRPKKILGLYFLIVISILSISAFHYFQKTPCPSHIAIPVNCSSIAFRNTLLETSIFGVGIIFLALFFILKRRILFVCLIVLISSIGIYNAYKFIPFSTKESFYPKNSLVQKIQNLSRNGERVFGFGNAHITTNFATFFRYYDPEYYHPLYIKRYGEIISFANTGKFNNQISRSDIEIISDTRIDPQAENRRTRLLSILGVKYFLFENFENKEGDIIWKGSKWHITENSNAQLPLYLVGQYETIINSKRLLERLFKSDFDYKNSVLLEKSPSNPVYRSRNSRVNIKSYKENKVVAEISTDKNQLLVFLSNNYPGWRATIDGKEAEILRANYSFNAVEVQRGAHTVLFYYSPLSIKIGGIISLVSTTALLFLFTIKLKFKKSL